MIPFTSDTALMAYLLQLPVSSEMITCIAQKATDVVANMQGCTRSPVHRSLPSISYYITYVVQESRVLMGTLLASLVYLSRLESRLPSDAKAVPSTAHRIFLATLIIADKNLNDKPQMNCDWVRNSVVPGFASVSFPITEINLMERQLLHLLDWDVRIEPQDLHPQLELLSKTLHIQYPVGQELALSKSLTREQHYASLALANRRGHGRGNLDRIEHKVSRS